MFPVDDLFAAYARTFQAHREAEMTLPEYLEACRQDPMVYSTATERLLDAIEPEMVDTAKDTTYVLKASDQISPVFESPLEPFNPERMGAMLEENFGIPQRRLTGLLRL